MSSSGQSGLLDLRMAESESSFPCPRSFDIQWSDLSLLLRCRFRDFRFRRERRLFDMVDTHHTGYVTLDELIQFRDNNKAHFKGAAENISTTEGHGGHADVSKSLLALYHFDVALDGHFSFEEFLLLQAYLQDVAHDDDGAVVCRCIPRNWLKASWWRRRIKYFSNKYRRGQMKKDGAGAEGPVEEHLLQECKKSVRFEHEERVLHRRVNDHGQLHEIECDDQDLMHQEYEEDHDHFESAPPCAPTVLIDSESGGSLRHLGSQESLNFSDEDEEEDEDPEFLAAKEEKKKNRRALLVQALKSNKGRKRFIDWLYRLADTTETDRISMQELVTFLKAIYADGINPEIFVDPAEDIYDDDRTLTDLNESNVTSVGSSPGRYRRLDKSDPGYIDRVGRRIMMRYNESNSGSLSREEFMQLATMIEREYELSDNNFSSAEGVGPYRFIRTLGKGAEGVVKLAINAEDETLGKRAVKIIKRGNIACLARIDREVEAMVMLDHPTVVACLEVLETESSICLVVEYCAGGHIGDYISPTRPLTESAARFYFSQLVDGLSYCHGHCVCHRDLRIENLMLDNKGDLKITDFGHAGIFQQVSGSPIAHSPCGPLPCLPCRCLCCVLSLCGVWCVLQAVSVQSDV
jgi:tRNA A-37 threonylcarbamoyl transferase component Bud32